MAKTFKDVALKNSIENVINRFKDKSDKEIIFLIAAHCKISVRTASEHFRIFQAQQTLTDLPIQTDCVHQWSPPSSTPSGLMKECSICGATKIVEVSKF